MTRRSASQTGSSPHSSHGNNRSLPSSRSTSFSLPTDGGSGRPHISGSGTSETGGDDDEEELTPEQEAKHRAFARARTRHYSNEGEAMKKAQAMMADDDEEGEEGGNEDMDGVVVLGEEGADENEMNIPETEGGALG